MTGQYPDCPHCSRKTIFHGSVNKLEAAFDKNGQLPVLDQIDAWIANPKEKEAANLATFLDVIEWFGNDPETLSDREFRHLVGDIYELKASTLRVLFGGGICISLTANGGIKLPANVQPIPAPSNVARATNAFKKGTIRTPGREKQIAQAILKTDGK